MCGKRVGREWKEAVVSGKRVERGWEGTMERHELGLGKKYWEGVYWNGHTEAAHGNTGCVMGRAWSGKREIIYTKRWR